MRKIVEMKKITCRICKRLLPEASFGVNRNNDTGRQTLCRECLICQIKERTALRIKGQADLDALKASKRSLSAKERSPMPIAKLAPKKRVLKFQPVMHWEGMSLHIDTPVGVKKQSLNKGSVDFMLLEGERCMSISQFGKLAYFTPRSIDKILKRLTTSKCFKFEEGVHFRTDTNPAVFTPKGLENLFRVFRSGWVRPLCTEFMEATVRFTSPMGDVEVYPPIKDVVDIKNLQETVSRLKAVNGLVTSTNALLTKKNERLAKANSVLINRLEMIKNALIG